MSTYLEDALNNHIRGGTAFSQPASLNVKMHTGNPGAACTANPAGETTRKAATFGASSTGVMANTGAVSWTAVSTTETWTHFSIWDASSGGNPLAYGSLTASQALTAGNNASFAIAALTWTMA